jgi:putative tryptophan/tyrosine transport system substrate-binding protein
MRRFAVALLTLALIAAPLAAEAQPATGRVARIGYLSFQGPRPFDDIFRQGLRDLGWVEGQNLVIEYRSADGNLERLRPLAEELARLGLALIVTTTGRGALAVKDVTTSVPIVMAASGDAVGQGLVASLARPGGNVTGLTMISPETTGKRLELLREAVPRLSRVAFLGCFESPVGRGELKEVQVAAGALGLQVQTVDVPKAGGLESALKMVAGRQTQAVLVSDCPSSFHPPRLAELTLQHRLPTMVPFAGLVQSGSLMSYGPSETEPFRRVANYVDRILKGAKPADLPVEQPTKFELVVNLKTAKALGLTIPQSVLLRADEVFDEEPPEPSLR